MFFALPKPSEGKTAGPGQRPTAAPGRFPRPSPQPPSRARVLSWALRKAKRRARLPSEAEEKQPKTPQALVKVPGTPSEEVTLPSEPARSCQLYTASGTAALEARRVDFRLCWLGRAPRRAPARARRHPGSQPLGVHAQRPRPTSFGSPMRTPGAALQPVI